MKIWTKIGPSPFFESGVSLPPVGRAVVRAVSGRFGRVGTFVNRESDASYSLHTCPQAVMSLHYSDRMWRRVKNRSLDGLCSNLVSLLPRGGKVMSYNVL